MGIWQIIYIALIAMGLGITLVKHGDYKEGKHNFWISLISAAIEITILALGGFFR